MTKEFFSSLLKFINYVLLATLPLIPAAALVGFSIATLILCQCDFWRQ